MSTEKKNTELELEILGPELFELTEKTRKRRLTKVVVEGLAREMGDLRAEEERRKGVRPDGAICVGCIIMPEDVRKYLAQNCAIRYLGLLRETGGDRQVRGCVIAESERSDVYEITEMFVESKWRGKGWGGKLLEEVVRRVRAECKGRDVRIELAVAGNNARTESFYRRHGFEVTEKRMTWRIAEDNSKRTENV